MSTATWPSTAYQADFVIKANKSAYENGKRYKYDGDAAEYTEFLKETMLSLEVFYEQLNYEKIESIPTYTWNNLLGDIGGQLGLYLGFSLLTAIEWIELVYDVAKIVCCGRSKVDHSASDNVEKVEL